MPVPLPPAPPPKEEVIRRLRQAMPTLQKLYVNRLALYGSVARDEQRQGSDIDLLVGFDESLMQQQTGQRLSLFHVAEVQCELEDLFDCEVGLSLWRDQPTPFQQRIEPELLRVA